MEASMRFGRLHWTMVFVIALLAPCGLTGRAAGEFISGDAATFVGEFRAFLTDFPRWDAAHLQLPLIALAMTPEENRPAMLLLLWDLWMHEHPSASTATANFPLTAGLPGTSPPVTGAPGTGSGGGTISDTPGPPGGGGIGGPPQSAPEPSSLALMACGGVGLFGLRLVRARRAPRHALACGDGGQP
jgi:hypothetical protein